VTKTAILQYGCDVFGIRDGYDGFLGDNGILPLGLNDVRGILPRGGTILGAANRGNPYARKVIRDGKEVTFGFDTALNIATEAIDRLHTTAESHHRVMVVELMGRDAGFIALQSGVSGGADVILIPEIPFKYEAILAKVRQRVERGSYFSILAVSEGVKPQGGSQVFSRSGDEVYVPRLGGIGQTVGEYLEKQGVETRVTVLGHVQRGGTPTAFDRWLATRYGAAAVRLAAAGGFDRMVALVRSQITDVSLAEALAVPKRVDVHGDAVVTARGMGIFFGDEI
jgi:6-phosphofructokinase 1